MSSVSETLRGGYTSTGKLHLSNGEKVPAQTAFKARGGGSEVFGHRGSLGTGQRKSPSGEISREKRRRLRSWLCERYARDQGRSCPSATVSRCRKAKANRLQDPGVTGGFLSATVPHCPSVPTALGEMPEDKALNASAKPKASQTTCIFLIYSSQNIPVPLPLPEIGVSVLHL